METEDRAFRYRDLLPLTLKRLVVFAVFNAASFVLYAMIPGQMLDPRMTLPRQQGIIYIFSFAVLAVFCAAVCLNASRNASTRTALLHAASDKSFSAAEFYLTTLKTTVLPFFIAGTAILLPYSVFYTVFGFAYAKALPLENIFAGNLLFIIPLGGIVGCIVENLVLSGVLALTLYLSQRTVLAARIRDPKKEKSELEDDLP